MARSFNALPETFTIYRGAKNWNTSRLCWIPDVYQAVRFATNHHDAGEASSLPPDMIGVIMKKTIYKSAVLLYTNEGSKDE